MNIDAGELDQRIALEYQTEQRTPMGAVRKAWQPLPTHPTVWAKVFNRSGVEGQVANQQLASATARFRIRFRDDLDETMRVIYKGKAYDIKAVLDLDGRRAFLELMCETGKRLGQSA